MRSVHWRRVTVPAAVAAFLVARGIHSGPGQDAEDQALRILSPADQSVLNSGKLEVLCVLPADADETERPAPELTVDGAAHAWEEFRPPVLLGRVELEPGRHEIRVGPTTMRVFVKGDESAADGPEGWAAWVSHPSTTSEWKDCTQCHKTGEEEGLAIVSDIQEPDACLKCHSAEDFELTHFHPLDPIAACHDCHAIHGSPRPSLLKGEVKALCAACHE